MTVGGSEVVSLATVRTALQGEREARTQDPVHAEEDRNLRAVRSIVSRMQALENPMLDVRRSNELFQRLMVRMELEAAQRRRRSRMFRLLGVAVGMTLAGAGALSFY